MACFFHSAYKAALFSARDFYVTRKLITVVLATDRNMRFVSLTPHISRPFFRSLFLGDVSELTIAE